MLRHALALPLAATLLSACAAARPPAAVEAPLPPDTPVERAWPVMGTMLRAAVWDPAGEGSARVLREVRAAVTRVDSLMSNYRDDSEVSRINRAAGSGRWTRVSAETLEVLELAMHHGRSSGGAFDPTVGPVVDVWGFYRETGALPPGAALDSARALVGWRHIEVDRGARRVRLPRAGMRLDLGAIAKGYAVDLALRAASRAGAQRLLVDLGGNIGVLGSAPGGGAWPLGLRHPREDRPFAVVDVETGALASSGDYERYFVHDGVRYAHIIDPRSGWPVRGVASVSVLAPTGVASDALSTALFVMGPERGCAAIEGLAGVAAVWIQAPDPGAEGEPLRAVIGGELGRRIGVGADVEVTLCADFHG